jgi:hypothetical protein
MSSVATMIINKTNKPSGQLSTDKKRWDFPKLEKLNKNNRVQYWQIFVELMNVKTDRVLKIKDDYFNNESLEDNIVGRYYTISGLEDGKIVHSEYTIIEYGKNLGKKNQTNVFTQTLMQSRTIYNKYVNKYDGFKTHNEQDEEKDTLLETNDKKTMLLKPMLAHIYDKKRVDFKKENIYIQPKLDGLRMIYHNQILYTRELKYYNGKDYIKQELNEIKLPNNINIKDLYLDGELYVHNLSLQEINSLGRKANANPNIILEYHIYDLFITSNTNKELLFEERLKILEYIKKNNNFNNIKIVDTHKVESFEDIEKYYDYYLKQNYEGIMVRFGNSKYDNNKRSYNLLKYKPILDNEFIIIDITTGVGKNKDIPLFVLSAVLKGFKERIDESELQKYKDLKLFKASLKNYSVEDAKNLYKELIANNKELFYEKYYLCPAVCQLLNYSNDDIPRSCYILNFLLD